MENLSINLLSEIRKVNDAAPEMPAIQPVDKPCINYQKLWEIIKELSLYFTELGIMPGDAVAVAMPEGPEPFIVFLAVTGMAVFAPLNHNLKTGELEEQLIRLKPRVLILHPESQPGIKEVAAKLIIPVIEIILIPKSAWEIEIKCITGWFPAVSREYDKDTALLMFTSATTGRSKLVPLSHRQMIAIVRNLDAAIPFYKNGRMLIVMPHYHLHSIMAVLTQFFSGGCIIVTPGLALEKFAGWMRQYQPNHFSGNPTMMMAIQSVCSHENRNTLFGSLRHISSSGSALHPELNENLEDYFGVPIFDSYGMTETGRISMVSLNRSERKYGSVGKIFGVEVAIADERGKILSPNETGEILIRGDAVFSGYIDDPDANRESFRDGWFRSGDIGYLDEDGFLFLNGRIKEMINRAGEKILPYEIEAVLMKHPAVKEAAVFGYPHPRMGEDVGACLVLKSKTTKLEIKSFLKDRISLYKIPRLILFVDQIPKSQTGKAVRTQMARIYQAEIRKLQMVSEKTREPSDLITERIIHIWEDILGIKGIAPVDDFFLIGGDSLLAAAMIHAVETEFNIRIAPESLILKSTPAFMAKVLLEKKLQNTPLNVQQTRCKDIVSLQPAGNQDAWFIFPITTGSLLVYKHLVRSLGTDSPVYGLKLPYALTKVDNTVLRKLGRNYAQQLTEIQPDGKYWLIGYSAAGYFAWATATELIKMKREIGGIFLIDTLPYIRKPLFRRILIHTSHFLDQVKYHIHILGQLPSTERFTYLPKKALNRMLRSAKTKSRPASASEHNQEQAPLAAGQAGSGSAGVRNQQPALEFELFDIGNITWEFDLKPAGFKTLLFWCPQSQSVEKREEMIMYYRKILGDNLHITEFDADHKSIFGRKNLTRIAAEIMQFRNHHSRQ